MEQFAARERRGDLLIGWSFTQLEIAGSTERLLNFSLKPRFQKQQT
jgi:hypothetical protein